MQKIVSNISLTVYIAAFITVLNALISCSMMPRTVLDSDSGEIIESAATSGKYRIHILPLNQVAVTYNNKSSYIYTIGNRDQLSIFVWGHPEFSSPLGSPFTADRNPLLVSNSAQVDNTTMDKDIADMSRNSYTIDEDGNVFLPMVGMIKCEGKTINQVRQELTARLAKYVVNPQVSIRMASFRSKKTYVLGEVSKPTAIFLNDAPLDLSAALSYAGWVNINAADVKNIYVLRLINNNEIDVYRLDATTPTTLLFASGFVMKPSDVIFVSTAGVAQFNRVMTQFLNAAQAIWFAGDIRAKNTVVIP